MTDNEKAATYIGWPAGTPNAPDMQRPANYMKAMIAMQERYPKAGLDFIEGNRWIFWLDPVKYACIIAEGLPSPGEAVVKGLATLYDKDHP